MFISVPKLKNISCNIIHLECSKHKCNIWLQFKIFLSHVTFILTCVYSLYSIHYTVGRFYFWQKFDLRIDLVLEPDMERKLDYNLLSSAVQGFSRTSFWSRAFNPLLFRSIIWYGRRRVLTFWKWDDNLDWIILFF